MKCIMPSHQFHNDIENNPTKFEVPATPQRWRQSYGYAAVRNEVHQAGSSS